jgi:ribosomal protein S18 acetylase RimI-like enzyme
MTSGVSIEILDLRHFSSAALQPLLESEREVWRQRLHWDYSASIRLLRQYLDSHMLPGYAAIEADQVIGYVFCVYEGNKAIIGDIFALPGTKPGSHSSGGSVHEFDSHEVEKNLFRHLFELLLNSPQLDRIESQLLLHASGDHAETFREAGFQIYRRFFMVRPLEGALSSRRANLPKELELRPWRDDDLASASRLIMAAYRDHPDSLINDQYCSVNGSLRFLNNIVRYNGCGAFSMQASHVVVERSSRELMALVLGSRVSSENGHITQICVHPRFRRCGLARMLLGVAACHFIRLEVREISLTVTESNPRAVALYLSEGYEVAHSFDAAVWRRESFG